MLLDPDLVTSYINLLNLCKEMDKQTASFKVRLCCCDPFHCHPVKIVKGLRTVTESTKALHPSLNFQVNDQICTKCRKQVSKLSITDKMTLTDGSSSDSSDDKVKLSSSGMAASAHANADETFVSQDNQLSLLNESLQVLGESPVVNRKVKTRVHYVKKKVKTIQTAVKRKLELVAGVSLDESEHEHAESEVIDQLKEKFRSCATRSEKVQVLTVLPKSWSAKRIQDEFNATNYMARKAKNLVEIKGILSTPNEKAGRTLPTCIVEDVRAFYASDIISRLMPGMKDYVSVYVDGVRQHKQKRLVLCNLKEAFEQFKQTYASHKIGFSKFAELRPKECILAGGSGTHSVCVCTIHQNLKLMFQGAKLESVQKKYSYRNCLAEIQCNPPRIQCYLGRCEECPGVEKLQSRLEQHFDDKMTDRIEFKQWTTTDRATLETKVLSVDEFLALFLDNLPVVLLHDFTAKQQSIFLQKTKSMLKPGEFAVVGDFAENYSFVLQDAAQSFHWNNLQATIHPFVCYYVDDATDGDNTVVKPINHVSFVVVSESNSHDTVAVHLFQKVLISFLSNKIRTPKRIIYFSDGCAAQYKNRKNFVNLCHHEEDFGMPAEWHFFATSHGKGPCDGVGGTVKRLAARASLQRPYDNQILTPRQLYEFGCAEIPTVNFYYATSKEYERESVFLSERFHSSKTIAGTHRLHSFRPMTYEKLEVREFSASEEKRIEHVSLALSNIIVSSNNIGDITGYVTVKYDSCWWLACVIKTMSDSGEVEVSFLHPHGPEKSFKYPPAGDILVISSQDVLTAVNPTTATGRAYMLTTEEMIAASAALAQHLKFINY